MDGDVVPVGWIVGENGEGGEPFVRHVLQLLGATKGGDGKPAAVEVEPNGGDMGTAVRTDGSERRHVRPAEKGFDVCGDEGGHIEP